MSVIVLPTSNTYLIHQIGWCHLTTIKQGIISPRWPSPQRPSIFTACWRYHWEQDLRRPTQGGYFICWSQGIHQFVGYHYISDKQVHPWYIYQAPKGGQAHLGWRNGMQDCTSLPRPRQGQHPPIYSGGVLGQYPEYHPPDQTCLTHYCLILCGFCQLGLYQEEQRIQGENNWRGYRVAGRSAVQDVLPCRSLSPIVWEASGEVNIIGCEW